MESLFNRGDNARAYKSFVTKKNLQCQARWVFHALQMNCKKYKNLSFAFYICEVAIIHLSLYCENGLMHHKIIEQNVFL